MARGGQSDEVARLKVDGPSTPLAFEGPEKCSALDGLISRPPGDVRMVIPAGPVGQFDAVPDLSELRHRSPEKSLPQSRNRHGVTGPSCRFEPAEGCRGVFLCGGTTVRVGRPTGADRMHARMISGHIYRTDQGVTPGRAHTSVGDGAGLSTARAGATTIAPDAERGLTALPEKRSARFH